MRVLSIFSGIGAFDLGLQRAGMEIVRQIEIDPFCRAVLKKHWPDVPCDGDVTTAEFTEGEADVICGGFPCQDVSRAGKRAGITGERSGLFRELVRAIRLVRPKFALMENVAAILSGGLGSVLGELASIGYDCEYDCIPASFVGASHLRDRWWLIAYPAVHGRVSSFFDVVKTQASAARFLARVGAEEFRKRGAASIVCGRTNAVARRVDRVAALGNALDPQIPELIGRAILAATPEQGRVG